MYFSRATLFKSTFLIVIKNGFSVSCRFSSATILPKYRVIFFGNDTFSLKSLSLLNEARFLPETRIDKIDVITSFKHKNNPVLRYSKENELSCTDWKFFNVDECTNQYDVGAVVSFGQLLPGKLINMIPHGILNVHGSLLPKLRGACPIIHSILNGDAVTGVSIMKIHAKKMDVGEILGQYEVPISNDILMTDLHDILADHGANLLLKCINDLPTSIINAKSQRDIDATYAPKLDESMLNISWHQMSSNYIQRLYRAFYSKKWLLTNWQGKRIKIREINISPNHMDTGLRLDTLSTPGSIMYDRINKCIYVYCSDSKFIRIEKLQVENRRVINATEFNAGYIKKVKPCDRYFT